MADELATLQTQAGEALDAGNLEEAEVLFEKALSLSDDRQHLVEMGIILQNQARLRRKQARLDDAKALCKKAISILEAALGPQTIDLYQTMHERHRVQAQMASALSTLAGLHRSAREYDDAEALLRRAQQVTEAALGADHNQMATCHNNLGMLLFQQGRFGESEPLLRRAVEVMRKAVGLYELPCSKLLSNVAALLEQQIQKYEISGPEPGEDSDLSVEGKRAEAKHLRTLAEIIQNQQGSHKERLVTEAELLCETADAYQKCGVLEDAERLLKESVHLVELAHGENDYRVAVMLTNLAVAYQSYSPPNCAKPHPKVALAEGLLRRAMGITSAAYGQGHAEVAQRAENLATFYLSQGRLGDAEPLLEASIAISEEEIEQLKVRDVEPDERQVGKLGLRKDKLGRLRLQQGNPEGAETLLHEALENLQAAFGPVHPDVGYCVYNLADLNRAFGREDEAAALTKHALEIQELARSE